MFSLMLLCFEICVSVLSLPATLVNSKREWHLKQLTGLRKKIMLTAHFKNKMTFLQ